MSLRRFWVRTRFLWIIVLAALLLSGCVQYDVGVNFDNPNHGTIVQHVKLGERFTSFGGDSAQEWLNSIELRARQLQGKAKRISNQEVTVTIPFNNGAELAAKFNEFFNPGGQQNEAVTGIEAEIPGVESRLSLTQNNLLLLLRNRLSYELDLRSLSLFSTNSNVQVSPNEILDLKFGLDTPWGARSVETENSLAPDSAQGRRLVWTLKPGQLNHLEAVFWLPSPLGIGTVVIILFVAAGFYLRYSFMPDPRTIQPPRRPAT